MTTPVDDSSDMNSTGRAPALSDSDVEALLAGRVVPAHPGLQAVVGVMRTAAGVAAPTPSAALAAVLAGGFDPSPVIPAVLAPAPWRHRAAQVVLAAVAALTATAGAAAANVLPPAVQSTVADVVEAVTPFDVPRPGDTGGAGTPAGFGPQTSDVRTPVVQAPASGSSLALEPVGQPVLTTLSGDPDATAARGLTDVDRPVRDAREARESDETDRDDREEPGAKDRGVPGDDARGEDRSGPGEAQDRDEADPDAPDGDAAGRASPDSASPDSASRDSDSPDEPDAPELIDAAASDLPDSDLPDSDLPDSDLPDSDLPDSSFDALVSDDVDRAVG